MKQTLLIGLVAFFYQSAFAVTVTVQVEDEVCTMPGTCTAVAYGGMPPYTYLWSNGATTQSISVSAGTYTVTVTDATPDQATASGTVIQRDRTQDVMSGIVNGSPSEAYCPDAGRDYPYFRWPPSTNIPGPYFFNGNEPLPEMYQDWLGYLWYYVPVFTPGGQIVPPGQVAQMQFMDGNGCPGSFTVISGYPVVWPVISVVDVQGACGGAALGSITVAYSQEGHQYPIATEVRNMQDQIVIPIQFPLHGESATTEVFTGLAAGQYRLIQRTNTNPDLMAYDWCTDEITVTVPDLGTNCGNVTGSVFMDYDQNCVQGLLMWEPRVPGALLEFTPGPYYATTSANGDYGISLPNGTYTVQQTATAIAQHCPPQPTTVTVNSNGQTLNLADTALVPVNAEVMLANGPARPGFQLTYAIRQQNLTPATTGATSTTLTFDPALSFDSAIPAPTSVNGNVLTWNQTALAAFQERTFEIWLQVPSDVTLIGTVLNASVTLNCANTDGDLSNNTASTSVTVTGSYDPNDKRAQTSSGLSDQFYFIDADEYIDYTIRFQNTGTDTAFTVIVTDTLPTTLDPGSIIWGATSHAGSRSLTGQGIVKFIFPNILLPDSNANEAASHGFASFRIKPRQPLTPGTQIENIANIYFDYNPPVITDPSVLLAEFNTGVQAKGAVQNMWLMPNPTSGSLEVRVSDLTAGLLQVVSVDGRVVLQQRIEGPRTILDVAQLSRGLYTLNWHDVNGTITTQRFVRE